MLVSTGAEALNDASFWGEAIRAGAPLPELQGVPRVFFYSLLRLALLNLPKLNQQCYVMELKISAFSMAAGKYLAGERPTKE